jgi:circadian clock protein KaiB
VARAGITTIGCGDPDGRRYVLRLYVSGGTPNSIKAIANIKSLCEEVLSGRYQMEVVDIYQDPTLASEDQVVAIPTLVKRSPPPRRRLVGDMSTRERVLAGLGLMPRTFS